MSELLENIKSSYNYRQTSCLYKKIQLRNKKVKLDVDFSNNKPIFQKNINKSTETK